MMAKAGLLLAAMMLLAPAVAAEEEFCSPPCGWIQPYLDIIVEDKLTCGSGMRLGDEDIDPDTCYGAPGEPVTIDATLILYWELSEDGTYPHDPNEPIVVDFSSAGNNGKWLKATVSPDSVTIDTAELLNPENLELRDVESGSPSIWFVYEAPIQITYEKVGEPSKEDLDIIDSKGGYQPMFLRVHSGGSGAYFKESWALEEFRFFMDGDQVGQSNGSSESKSTPAVPALLALIGLAFLARRRPA